MGEIDDILTRVETGDAGADAKALAAEVRRLRTELQSQREADTDRVLDQMTDLFPTEGAKRMAQRRTARRKDDLESGLPDPQHPRQDDPGQPKPHSGPDEPGPAPPPARRARPDTPAS